MMTSSEQGTHSLNHQPDADQTGMSGDFLMVLEEYRAKASQDTEIFRNTETQAITDMRDDLLLDVGEAQAEFLRSLIIARNAQLIIELGTSFGYSTLFLADAARQTGGRLVTFEMLEKKQSHAQAQIARAGLADHVDFRLGDAVELLDEVEGPVDFVFIDLWKDLYIPCFEALEPKLAPGAIIAADNMTYPPSARADAKAYRDMIASRPEFTSTLLHVGSGIELSCLQP